MSAPNPWMSERKSPGQVAYEEDCRLEPLYHHGAPRVAWDRLDLLAQQSWERNPTARRRRP